MGVREPGVDDEASFSGSWGGCGEVGRLKAADVVPGD